MYVKGVHAIYEACLTAVRHAVGYIIGSYVSAMRCVLGITKWIKVGVELHQRLALSPFLLVALRSVRRCHRL